MRRTLRRIRWNNWLMPILLFALICMSYGIWLLDPHVLLADEKAEVTKALSIGVSQSIFIRDFKKGGNLYLYFLAAAFVVPFVYLTARGRLSGLAGETGEISNFYAASEALQDAFYVFVFSARLMSVMLGLATIYLVYAIGAHSYDERTGLAGAAITSVTAGYLQTAQFATEDMLLIFLTTLALYFLSQTDRRASLWAAITVGLAVSTKATGAFLVVPLIYVIVRENELNLPAVALWLPVHGALSLGAYLATTPSILVYPGYFIQEMLYELSTRGIGGTAEFPGWIVQLGNILSATGWPLFVLMIVAAGWSGRRLYTQESVEFETVAWLFILPYYAFIGSWSNTDIWYILPFLPVLSVMAGAFTVSWIEQVNSESRQNNRLRKRATTAGLALLLVTSGVYAGLSAAQNGTDARVSATEWMETNIEPGADVDTYSYRIYLPEFRGDVNVNRYLVTGSSGANWTTPQNRLECQRPDVVVLSSSHYKRFLSTGMVSAESQSYRKLLDGGYGYSRLATFGPEPESGGVNGILLSGVVPRELAGDTQIVILGRVAGSSSC